MIFAGKTDKGLKRNNNEDALFYQLINGWGVYIVADGMGGHSAGEIASKLAVETISNILKSDLTESHEGCNVIEVLIKAVKIANEKIYEKSNSETEFAGMGTTLSSVLTNKNVLVIAHVGDSRIYLLRGEELIQLTSDHSYVAELLKNGVITKEEAKTHPKKNYIYRNLGYELDIEIDTSCNQYLEGDKILICSDGLSNQIDDYEIKQILLENTDPQASIDKLIDLVIKRGGYDNITAVVVHNVGGSEIL